MQKAVIFDLDGTLLDTLHDLADAVNVSLAFVGLPKRSVEEVRSFVGNGAKILLERSVGADNMHLHEKALAKFQEYYVTHCEIKTQLYAGIKELLEQLKSRGIKTAIVSNKPDYAVKKLAKTYFADFIEIAIGENESAGIRKKPAPDSLLAVMKTLKTTAAETLYVGDSEVDIQTAKNAGVEYISVSWGFKDKPFLKAHGAKIIVDTPREILSCIGE